jgi:hypothetical protein
MKLSDLLQLPPGAMLGFTILIWPALWATFLIVVALTGDLTRQIERRPEAVRHKAA